MNELGKSSTESPESAQVSFVDIDEESAGQRIDNFLFRVCKGVPKSHIYRILRSGEVRVNKGRIDATYRLVAGDRLRLPPMRVGAPASHTRARAPAANFPILFEDSGLLAIDKPAGVAVHGGSGVSHGVIEQLRQARPDAPFLELVHRLDRDTSGVLLLAKKRSALLSLHEQLRGSSTDKRYLACVVGDWHDARRVVKAPLYKYVDGNGERRVRVQEDGSPSHTIFRLLERFGAYSLLEAELKTGRTHQIRVHLAHLDMPIVGDDKYGDFAVNRQLARGDARPGIKRMFLHAARFTFAHPVSGALTVVEAPLPAECGQFLNQLKQAFSHGPTTV
ncbi:MAG: RluA family pseudouridine synthase [Janthinobacterium lividum]